MLCNFPIFSSSSFATGHKVGSKGDDCDTSGHSKIYHRTRVVLFLGSRSLLWGLLFIDVRLILLWSFFACIFILCAIERDSRVDLYSLLLFDGSGFGIFLRLIFRLTYYRVAYGFLFYLWLVRLLSYFSRRKYRY